MVKAVWVKALVPKYLSTEIHESLLELASRDLCRGSMRFQLLVSVFLMHIHSSVFSLSMYFNLSYAIRNRKGEHWKHEYASEMMFDYLVRDNNIPISEKDQRFIKALIAGEPSRT